MMQIFFPFPISIVFDLGFYKYIKIQYLFAKSQILYKSIDMEIGKRKCPSCYPMAVSFREQPIVAACVDGCRPAVALSREPMPMPLPHRHDPARIPLCAACDAPRTRFHAAPLHLSTSGLQGRCRARQEAGIHKNPALGRSLGRVRNAGLGYPA